MAIERGRVLRAIAASSPYLILALAPLILLREGVLGEGALFSVDLLIGISRLRWGLAFFGIILALLRAGEVIAGGRSLVGLLLSTLSSITWFLLILFLLGLGDVWGIGRSSRALEGLSIELDLRFIALVFLIGTILSISGKILSFKKRA